MEGYLKFMLTKRNIGIVLSLSALTALGVSAFFSGCANGSGSGSGAGPGVVTGNSTAGPISGVESTRDHSPGQQRLSSAA